MLLLAAKPSWHGSDAYAWNQSSAASGCHSLGCMSIKALRLHTVTALQLNPIMVRSSHHMAYASLPWLQVGSQVGSQSDSAARRQCHRVTTTVEVLNNDIVIVIAVDHQDMLGLLASL
jgi:hypothetical protein